MIRIILSIFSLISIFNLYAIKLTKVDLSESEVVKHGFRVSVEEEEWNERSYKEAPYYPLSHIDLKKGSPFEKYFVLPIEDERGVTKEQRVSIFRINIWRRPSSTTSTTKNDYLLDIFFIANDGVYRQRAEILFSKLKPSDEYEAKMCYKELQALFVAINSDVHATDFLTNISLHQRTIANLLLFDYSRIGKKYWEYVFGLLQSEEEAIPIRPREYPPSPILSTRPVASYTLGEDNMPSFATLYLRLRVHADRNPHSTGTLFE